MKLLGAVLALLISVSCATRNVTQEFPYDPWTTQDRAPTFESVTERLKVPLELQDDLHYAIDYTYGPTADGPHAELSEVGTLEQRRALTYMMFGQPWDMTFNEFDIFTVAPLPYAEQFVARIEKETGAKYDREGDFEWEYDVTLGGFFFTLPRNYTRQQLADMGDKLLRLHPEIHMVEPNGLIPITD